MSLNPIKQIRESTALRLSASIAVTLMICMFIFNHTVQPVIKSSLLKKNKDYSDYKLDEYRTRYQYFGYNSLVQIIRNYEKEARMLGVSIRIVNNHGDVLCGVYPNKTIEALMKGELDADTTTEDGWIKIHLPATIYQDMMSFLFGQKEYDHIIMLKKTRLDKDLTLEVGHTFQRVEFMVGNVAELFRYVNLFFTVVIFLCSVVFILYALRPLRRISKTIDKISRGDMTARVPLNQQKHKSDIMQMAEMFNGMLDKTETLVVRMKESLDNVAHDLRTPLSRMRLSIEEAVQKDDNESLKEALFDCAEEAEKLERLLKTLMNISEAEAETLNLYIEETDVNDVVRQSAKQYDYLLEDKNIDLRLQLADNVTIVADPSRIQQVVNNLLDNAIKFTPEGGNVEIITQDHNQSVLLSMKDSGVGISSDDQARIFERLYRADKSRSTKGLGLGLSLVKAVLKAHQSQIKVQSEPGKGSTFHILFPKDFKKRTKVDWNDVG
ncbi:HAMP domain-containing histidine kinase [bacterium]|nr:HAMP domain-containing histidine kinase [bacterium]